MLFLRVSPINFGVLYLPFSLMTSTLYVLNGFKFREACFVAQNVVYLGKCFMCTHISQLVLL